MGSKQANLTKNKTHSCARAKEFGKRLLIAGLAVTTISSCDIGVSGNGGVEDVAKCEQSDSESIISGMKSMKFGGENFREQFMQTTESEHCAKGGFEWIESEKHMFSPNITFIPGEITSVEFFFMGKSMEITKVSMENGVSMHITNTGKKFFLEESESASISGNDAEFIVVVLSISQGEAEFEVMDRSKSQNARWSSERLKAFPGTITDIGRAFIVLYDVGVARYSGTSKDAVWIGLATESFILQDGASAQIFIGGEEFTYNTTIEYSYNGGKISISSMEIHRKQ